MSLQIHLFGSPRFVLAGEPLRLSRRKSIALLAYLVVTDQPQSRDAFLGLLWPEYESAAARANLRRDLSWMRRMLPDDLLVVDRLQIDINPAAGAWLDVQAFEAGITAVAQHVHQSDELCDECAQRLAEAVDLYEGDFMAGFSLADSAEFEEWHFFQREEYRAKMVESLQQLISWCRGQQQYEQGIAYGRRWLALDPWHEQAHRALMTLYALTDQQAAALRQYDECVRLLEEELGIEPESETQVLFEAIRNREFGKADLKENGAEKDAGGQKPEEAAKDEILPTDFELPLPTPITPFIGREQELANIVELLSRPETRLITVVGPGGMGKTRLALAVATAVMPHFKHDAHLISLASLSVPEHIVPTVASTLNLGLSGTNPQSQLLDYLRDKEMLLLMDNFEHLLPGASFLMDVLQAAPKVKILVTSRERLNLTSEAVFVLGGLSVTHEDKTELSQAFQLFQHHVSLVRSNLVLQAEDYQIINQICEMVDGMPLALILAASWSEILAFTEIAEEIDRSLDFLETDMTDMPQRQRSIRAIFEGSWRRLTDEEKRTFSQLSLFRGGFTRLAAQAITGVTLLTLRGLVRKLFLTLETNGRYQIHELLRQFGAESLAKQTLATPDIYERHAAYYCQVLQDHWQSLQGRDHKAALAEIGVDIQNIQAAWEWVVAQKRDDMFVIARDSLGYFYEWQGRYETGNMAFQQASEAWPNDPANLIWHGRFLYILGQTATAVSKLQQAIILLEQRNLPTIDMQQQKGRSLQYLGKIRLHQGQVEVAQAHLKESLTLYKVANDDLSVAHVLIDLGYVAHELSNYLVANNYFEQGLHIYRTLGYERGVAKALEQMSLMARYQGDIEASEQLALESLDIYEKLGELPDLARGQSNLGIALNFMGRFADGETLLQKSLAILIDIGDREWLVETRIRLGAVQHHLGKLAEARQAFEIALSLAQTISLSQGIGFALHMLGEVAIAEEKYGEAEQHLRQCIALFQQRHKPSYIGRACSVLGICYLEAGDTKQSQRYLLEALQIGVAVPDGMSTNNVLMALAQILVRQGEIEQGIELHSLCLINYPFYRVGRGMHAKLREQLTVVVNSLPPNTIAAALKRGEDLDVWQVARSLLNELTELGWGNDGKMMDKRNYHRY